MKELSKEDQERNWTEDSVMTPSDKEWSNGYAKGYLDGRNKGFNEALEEVAKLIDTLEDYTPFSYIKESVLKLKR